MEKKVIIIGGGLSGLIAGSYLRMNGYETEVFEMHSLPGGLCTSWQKKGYTIDGCIHWLVGSGPSDNFYNLWNELIDLTKLSFVNHEVYHHVEDAEGKMIRIFCNIDRLEAELLDKAPEDARLIRTLCRAVRKLSRYNFPNDKATGEMNLADGLKFLTRTIPCLGIMRKYIHMTASEYALQYKNPILQKAFEHMFVPEMSVLFLFFTLAWMNKGSAGYPVGGSLAFARLFEEKYLQLGGLIHYSSKVKRIIYSPYEESIVASGIELENGEIHSSDIVISAADGYSTIWEMLEGKFLDRKVVSVYHDFKLFPSYLQVSLGIKGKLDVPNHCMLLPLEKPVMIDPETETGQLQVLVHHFDPTLAPEGSTLVTSLIPTYYAEYWTQLKKNEPEAYNFEKQRVAGILIRLLEKRFGIRQEHIEMTDVSSPATVIRYTNNRNGSFEGWLLHPNTGFRRISKTLAGLNNFYMIGQWVEPGGGLPSCLMSGRNVTRIICKKDGRKFRNRVYRLTGT